MRLFFLDLQLDSVQRPKDAISDLEVQLLKQFVEASLTSASSHLRQDAAAFVPPFLSRLADAWESSMKRLQSLDEKVASSKNSNPVSNYLSSISSCH
jgi:hypothetical protein